MIQAGGKTLHSQIHKLIHSIWNKEELPEQWQMSLLLYQFTRRVIKLTVILILVYHCYQLCIKLLSNTLPSR
jgi:hypothetical protein